MGHRDVPVECKPLVLENGVMVPLTSTAAGIRRPRLKTSTPQTEHDYVGHDTTVADVTIERRHLTRRQLKSRDGQTQAVLSCDVSTSGQGVDRARGRGEPAFIAQSTLLTWSRADLDDEVTDPANGQHECGAEVAEPSDKSRASGLPAAS